MARTLKDGESFIINYHGKGKSTLQANALAEGEIAVVYPDGAAENVELYVMHTGTTGPELVSFAPKAYVDEHAISGNTVTLSAYTDTGFYKKYDLKQGDTAVGTIEVPADKYVTSGEIVKGTDNTYTLKLTLANVASTVDVPLGNLDYTAQASATQIQVAIDAATRVISATVVAGSITSTELAQNSVTTSKIVDGNVTYNKMDSNAIASDSGAVESISAAGTKVTDAYAVKQFVNAKVDEINTAMTVTIETAETATAGMLKTYVIKQGDTEKGKIDIPKDFLVKSGSLKTVTEADKPYEGAVVGEKYIDLIINTKDGEGSESHVYIPLKDLVDVYTGVDGTQIKVEVDSDRKISATIKANAVGTTELSGNSVTAEKIVDGAVTENKIVDNAVTYSKIATGAVATTGAEITGATATGKVADAVAVKEAIANTITGVTVNSVTGTVADSVASVTIDGADIKLDGYTKATTASDVAATDTVNEAIGKVEKKADDAAADALTAVTTGNGISVSEKASKAQSISIKLNENADEKYLAVSADGLEVTGVNAAITTEIEKLDAEIVGSVTGASIYSVTVKEEDGKITAVTPLITRIDGGTF